MADAQGGAGAGFDDLVADGIQFLGEYRHTLDAKGRLILPADFREKLAGGAYVTKALDGGLAVVTPPEFQRRSRAMLELAKRGHAERQAARAFAAGSRYVESDSQGRVAIPQALREFAELERDVVVVGVYNRIEIWNPEKWAAIEGSGSNKLLSGEESLSEMGF